MFHRLVLGEQGKTDSPLLTRIRKNPFRIAVYILCLINISLIIVNLSIWIIAAKQKLFFAADFTAYYTGYAIVRSSDSANLYDLDTQTKYQRSFLDNLEFKGGVLPYISPPHVALVFSPLSLLRLEPAFYLWSVIQLGLLIWLLFTLNRQFLHWESHERFVMMLTILAFWPLINTFLLGQFSILLVIGLFQMYISFKKEKPSQAGFWLSLLSIKPHTLFIPAMLTLNKRYWRAFLISLLAAMLIFVISLLQIGVRPWLQYIPVLKNLSTYFGDYGVYPTIEYTLRGVLSNVFSTTQINLTNIISIVFLLLGMLFTWYLWRKGEAPDSSRFELLFALSLQLTAFLSLHMNPHDSLILILPAILFYEYLRKHKMPMNAFSLLLLISPMVFFIAAFNRFDIFGFIRPPVVIILAMLIWMIKYLVFSQPTTAPALNAPSSSQS